MKLEYGFDRDGSAYTNATYEKDGAPASAKLLYHLTEKEAERELARCREAASKVHYVTIR